MLNKDYIKDMIKKHEGFRDCVYKDSVGVLTGGWGHAFHEGSRLSKRVVNALFNDDFYDAETDTAQFISKHRLWNLNAVRKSVLINMMFNLGYSRLSKFKRFIKAMQDENYSLAADEMIDSKWASQVKSRAHTLAAIMETGRIE